MRVTENVRSKQQVSDEQDAPIRIVLPFKDQKAANAVRHQLSDLSRKIHVIVQPVYISKKIKGHFKPKEHKHPIVNDKTLFIITSVVCVIQTMSASRVDTYINVWRNTSDQQSAAT